MGKILRKPMPIRQSVENLYQVYALFDYNGVPFYIGATRNLERRMRVHNNNANKTEMHTPKAAKIREIHAQGRTLIVSIIADNLSQTKALRFEQIFIKVIGRGENGPLMNLTEGGLGALGQQQPDSAKQAKRAALLGKRQNPEWREKWLPVMKCVWNDPIRNKKLSESAKGFIWATNGTDNLRIRINSEIPTGYRRGRTQ